MEDKRVLVTGAGTGIGRGVALEFARLGAAVVLHYSHSEQGAASAVEEIVRCGGKATALAADFNDLTDVRSLATRALEFLGGLDVLVNNAGITMNLPFEKVTPEQFDTLYRVNVRAQFFLTQALVPALSAAGGAIVNVSSIHAFQGMPGHAVYAGTKGAIVAMTRELAIELAGRGIRVNCIAPGAVPVENYEKIAPGGDPAALGKRIPCGFAGTPHDVAALAVFLAGPEARYLVGQTIVLDGGTTSWISFGDGFRHPSDAPFGKGYVPGL
jgi:glucose 1-dehydrogenase/3-oxoacyl-[acyl-carrier protein] reductase